MDEFMPKPCPMEKFCKLIGSRWGCAIVIELLGGDEVSFNELRRALNANPKTLSTKLKQLEQAGLVRRRVLMEDRPIRVFYSLTNRGKELKEVENFLSKWMDKTG